jgi:ribosomal protein S18 acetylase RimI-like enzyme
MQLRPYDRSQAEAVQDLLFHARRQHIHLDWYRAANFLDRPDTLALTLWDNSRLLGVIACAPPLGGTQWVRLLAVDNAADAAVVVKSLVHAVLEAAQRTHLEAVYCIVINPWLSIHLAMSEFEHVEDVVTLSRTGDALPDLPALPYTVETAYSEQLPDLVAVDHAAFGPPWQMSPDEIRQAQRQAASCTVALVDGRIIGYQISTRYQNAAHLARLAVIPDHQGNGVGALLLRHAISSMLRRSVRAMTVNTQQSNQHSQRLYLRFGFQRNGYDLPVWRRRLR